MSFFKKNKLVPALADGVMETTIPTIRRVTPAFMSNGGTTYGRACMPCTPCGPDMDGPCMPCTPCGPDMNGPCMPCTPCGPDA